ncbi:MAG: DUF1846 domain-containing protein [Lachnospiraceae bacterium]|nr:DUF1846 domain-containing protein [Lachnospiraceae bacterium]
MKKGFDNAKYLSMQSEHIRERISQFGNKLYLEFGGKLFDDYHASRVLPGFEPDSKLQMLLQLKDQAEVVIVISAEDIEENKVRGDYGITYDMDVLRLIDAFQSVGLFVGSVCLTKFSGQPGAELFQNRLKEIGIKSYRHYKIPGYPSDVNRIVSDDGYGKNDYIETERPLVVITAPGPGSGKMATCLSQLYHEYKRGVKAGYAKFETFPIWNIPLKHPVNLAYEAATADLNDVNMIDPFHLEAYGVTTVNYNRDIEIFPVVNAIFQLIAGESPYKSPTDMGVNMAGNCIYDDEACCNASNQEIIRRYYKCLCERKRKGESKDDLVKLELLMQQAGITTASRTVVSAALEREEATEGKPAVAIELPDGQIVTGRTSDLLGSSAAALLNAIKVLGGIDDSAKLISPDAIEPIQSLKTNYLGSKNPRLHTDEVLIALSATAAHSDVAKHAIDQLPKLKGCEAHSSVLLSSVDEQTFKKLAINLTCEPKYEEDGKKYHKH